MKRRLLLFAALSALVIVSGVLLLAPGQGVPPTGSLIVQILQNGVQIGTFKHFLSLNCSTNLTCSFSGGQVTASAATVGAVQDTRSLAGATVDARIRTCVGLTPPIVCDASKEPASSNWSASLVISQSNVKLLMPLNSQVLDNAAAGHTITISGNNDVIDCQVKWVCVIDVSNNGAAGALTITGNNSGMQNMSVIGGFKNSQAGTEVNIGTVAGNTVSDDFLINNKIRYAGSSAITLSNTFDSFVNNNVIEQAGGACINDNEPLGGGHNHIWGNRLHDCVINQFVGIGDINIISNVASGSGFGGGQQSEYNDNWIDNGGLGPDEMGTANGGASGLATVTNGSTTVTWAHGMSFQAGWCDGTWHMRLADIDYKLANSGSCTTGTTGAVMILNTNYTGPTIGTNGVPFLVYRIPSQPSMYLCNSTVSTATITITGGNTATISNSTNCGFLSLMNTQAWTLNVAGQTATITSFTSATQVGFTGTISNQSNTATWSAYPTPADGQTGSGEGIQATATQSSVNIHNNYLFNIAEEGITGPSGGFEVVGNYVQNWGQSCQGCAGIISSSQAINNQIGVGPTNITGNTTIADSTFGTPSGGQGSTSNPTATIGTGIWLNTANGCQGQCGWDNVLVASNVIGIKNGGSMTNGFQLSAQVSGNNVWTITASSITSNVFSATATNNAIAGQTIILSGFATNTFLNGQTCVVSSTSLSSSGFQCPFTHANVGNDTGSAQQYIYLNRAVLGPNVYTSGITNQVTLNYANITGVMTGPDVPLFFAAPQYGTTAAAITSTAKVWSYYTPVPVTCDKIRITIQSAGTDATTTDTFDFEIYTGNVVSSGTSIFTRVCGAPSITGSTGGFTTAGDKALIPTVGAGAYIPGNQVIYLAVISNSANTGAISLAGSAASASAGSSFGWLVAAAPGAPYGTTFPLPATLPLIPALGGATGVIPNLQIF